jgi:RimJ/RimL family protein N-acetyltransferase
MLQVGRSARRLAAMTAPTLRTARLTLSAHRRADLDPLAAMWAAPAIYRHIGGQPRSPEEVWAALLRAAGQWALFGYGAWIVRDAATGELVGEVGLLESRRAIDPPLGLPEMGWVLAPAFHGRGLAREALDAVLAWADAQGIAGTCCIIDPANAPSLRLAERVGYGSPRTALYRDQAILILHRPG